MAVAAWFATALSLLAVAVYLRAAWLGDRQLFRDEAASWFLSRYPLGDLLRHATSEPFPPLYAVLLKPWTALLGDGEAALRSLSVLAGLAMLAVGWRWAHEALGRWPATLVLLVLSLSPVAIANARDARMYALESASATVAWWLVWRLLTGRARTPRAVRVHAAVLAIAVAGELWTLSLGLPTAALQGLVALGAFAAARQLAREEAEQRHVRTGARWALGAIVAGGVTFLPWLPVALRSAASGEAFWTTPPGAFDWAVSWGTMIVAWREDLPYFALLRAVALGLAAIGIAALLTSRDAPRRVLGACVVGAMALAVALWAVSLVRSIYDTRYLGATLAPFAIALVAGGETLIARAQRQVRRARGDLHPGRARIPVGLHAGGRLVLAAFLLGAMVRPTVAWLGEWRTEHGLGPTREVMAELSGRVKPGDVVLTVDARSFFPFAYQVHRRAARGESLPVPLRNWDSGREPFYRGQGLIDDGPTVRSTDVAARGWRSVLPDLAPQGHIWLVTVAHGTRERLGFDPLDWGDLREVERIVIARSGSGGQARKLALAADPSGLSSREGRPAGRGR